MGDPRPALRRRLAATTVIGGGALVAVALWATRFERPAATSPAAMSVDARGNPGADPMSDAETGLRRRPPVDRALFAVALWNPPPPPPAPAEPARVESAVPLRLELVGIVARDGRFVAALYDPADDRIHLVTDGDRIGAAEIVRVEAVFAEVHDGRRTHRLALRPDDSPRTGGGGRR